MENQEESSKTEFREENNSICKDCRTTPASFSTVCDTCKASSEVKTVRVTSTKLSMKGDLYTILGRKESSRGDAMTREDPPGGTDNMMIPEEAVKRKIQLMCIKKGTKFLFKHKYYVEEEVEKKVDEIVEPLKTSETDEKKVEIDVLKDWKVELDDELAGIQKYKAENGNYEENGKEEAVFHEAKKEQEWIVLPNGTIINLRKDLEERKNEQDVSNEKNNETSHYNPCPFCKHDLPFVGEGITIKLENCGHALCRWCVTEALQEIIQNKTEELKCPYVDNQVQCNSLIQEHQIRELVEPNLYEEYLEIPIDKIKKDAGNRLFNCKTAQCPGWCIVEDDRVDNFLCPVCKVNHYVDLKSNEKTEVVVDEADKYIQNERYNETLLLLDSDVIPNFEPFECPICFVPYLPREGMVLRNCLHIFCKVCIANTVLYSEDADIKCPYKNDDYSCDATIQQCEIKAVVKPDDFQKYLDKSIAQAESKAGKAAFHCKTPNCSGWCFYETGAANFLCPVCNQDNCFLCQKIHTGQGCLDDIIPAGIGAESKRSDALIEMMLQNGDAMLCPTCRAIIMKVEGCDALQCIACKTDICWVTRGPRWGPKGRYDNSGGCKCGINGKCHPNCRNCH